MILVIGGLGAGKRAYIREKLGYTDQDMTRDPNDGAPVVVDVQDLVFERGGDIEGLEEALAGHAVVSCCEVGSGVVPLDPVQRRAREQTGRLMTRLADRAQAVVRVFCGIGTVLKGELP